jgi:hypothetical protein
MLIPNNKKLAQRLIKHYMALSNIEVTWVVLLPFTWKVQDSNTHPNTAPIILVHFFILSGQNLGQYIKWVKMQTSSYSETSELTRQTVVVQIPENRILTLVSRPTTCVPPQYCYRHHISTTGDEYCTVHNVSGLKVFLTGTSIRGRNTIPRSAAVMWVRVQCMPNTITGFLKLGHLVRKLERGTESQQWDFITYKTTSILAPLSLCASLDTGSDVFSCSSTCYHSAQPNDVHDARLFNISPRRAWSDTSSQSGPRTMLWIIMAMTVRNMK